MDRLKKYVVFSFVLFLCVISLVVYGADKKRNREDRWSTLDVKVAKAPEFPKVDQNLQLLLNYLNAHIVVDKLSIPKSISRKIANLYYKNQNFSLAFNKMTPISLTPGKYKIRGKTIIVGNQAFVPSVSPQEITLENRKSATVFVKYIKKNVELYRVNIEIKRSNSCDMPIYIIYKGKTCLTGAVVNGKSGKLFVKNDKKPYVGASTTDYQALSVAKRFEKGKLISVEVNCKE